MLKQTLMASYISHFSDVVSSNADIFLRFDF